MKKVPAHFILLEQLSTKNGEKIVAKRFIISAIFLLENYSKREKSRKYFFISCA